MLTIFFLPIRSWAIPTGTDNMRNQIKTASGIIFARVLLRLKSALALSTPKPIRSQKLITKKDKRTGAAMLLLIAAEDEILISYFIKR